MTTTKAITGARGEDAAVSFLRKQGFLICERNWRNGRYEIDIIARKSYVTHIIEVKTRSVSGYTTPEDAITPDKLRSMRRAASLYLAQHRITDDVAFDLVAIDLFPDGSYDIRFIADIM
ncbi:MAG: YraN family protein [Rikenellaceae bacterium]|nr:YraN family protein [Rikenellaceae bacterium]MBR2014495.1 YraN family protein [Alistipes sp.]